MHKSKLFSQINTYTNKHYLTPENGTIIIGLSGGPDSMFLLHYLASSNLKLIVAHLDHEWRTDSYKDVEFCKAHAEKLGIPFVSKKLSELNLHTKFNGSKEEVARNARRFFLESVQKKYNADSIALAHHAQDQQETFFIRLLRGTGLSGLTGMQPTSYSTKATKDKCAYIRPLLVTNKADILAYLDEHQIPYLIDPSNKSDHFLRNRIRNHVIPALKNTDTRFDVSFSRTLAHLQETEDFLEELTEQTFATITLSAQRYPSIQFASSFAKASENRSRTTQGERLELNIQALLATPALMRQRILLKWLCKESVPFNPSKKFFAEMERFLQQPGSKEHQLHGAWKIIKKKNTCWIAKT